MKMVKILPEEYILPFLNTMLSLDDDEQQENYYECVQFQVQSAEDGSVVGEPIYSTVEEQESLDIYAVVDKTKKKRNRGVNLVDVGEGTSAGHDLYATVDKTKKSRPVNEEVMYKNIGIKEICAEVV
jgi:hypothetical protein